MNLCVKYLNSNLHEFVCKYINSNLHEFVCKIFRFKFT